MRFRLWLNVITLIALAVVVYFAWGDFAEALRHMTELNIWVLLLMIPVQFLAYYSLAKVFYHFFNATGPRLTMRQLFAPMLELNFVNHVFPSGGASGFSYLTVRLKSYGVSAAKSTLAQLARYVTTFLMFIGLMLLALFLLALKGDTSPLVVLAVSAITFTMLFGTGVLIFVIGHKRRIEAFTKRVTVWINRVIHMVRRNHPETISLQKVRHTFMELHQDYVLVRRNLKKMRPVFVWALITNLAEVALLYIAFLAHGEFVNPGAVVIALVVANIVGLLAILPGGVGLYEPLMAAVLISGGVSAGLAVSATLVYRVVTLLISLITGYILYHKAVNRYGKDRLTGK